MTGLLVSVRDAHEAQDAIAGGASVIDVKEPNAGALGASSPAVWHAVVDVVNRRVPCSVALGELQDAQLPNRIRQMPAVDFAKIGLAHCADDRNWRRHWQNALQFLPPTTTPVGVIYADWQQARAPHPNQVLRHATLLGCRWVLFDTYHKDRGWLLDHLTGETLGCLVTTARSQGLRVVLAGSIRLGTLAMAVQFAPDLIAVRGAVCTGGRVGKVETARVRALANACAQDDRDTPNPVRHDIC